MENEKKTELLPNELSEVNGGQGEDGSCTEYYNRRSSYFESQYENKCGGCTHWVYSIEDRRYRCNMGKG